MSTLPSAVERDADQEFQQNRQNRVDDANPQEYRKQHQYKCTLIANAWFRMHPTAAVFAAGKEFSSFRPEGKMMLFKLRNLRRDRKGQGLVEYAFIVAGVAFICLLALSVFGHKLSDQYGIMAGMLPGAHSEDNLPVASQSFLQTQLDEDGEMQIGTGVVSWHSIVGRTDGGAGLQNNVATLGNGGSAFIADHDDDAPATTPE